MLNKYLLNELIEFKKITVPSQPLDVGIKVGDLLSLNKSIWIEKSEMVGIFLANWMPMDFFFYRSPILLRFIFVLSNT